MDISKTIQAGELRKKTGATYRQIDYWCSTGLIFSVGMNSPGSGHKREFDEDVIEKVALLVKISKVLEHKLSRSMLKKVYDNYTEGSCYLGEGLYLSWKDEL